MNTEEQEILKNFVERENAGSYIEEIKEELVIPDFIFYNARIKYEFGIHELEQNMCAVHNCNKNELREELIKAAKTIKTDVFEQNGTLCSKEQLLEQYFESLELYENSKNDE